MSEPSPTSPTPGPRYQSLDVWRGLACLLVVLDHAGIPAVVSTEISQAGSALEQGLRWLVFQGTRLALGPPLFFVISGYCIAASIDSIRRKGKPASHFLLKRFWRTFPPYWIALLSTAALVLGLDALGRGQLYQGPYSYHLVSPSRLDWSQWIGNLTLSETWRPQVFGGEPLLLSEPSWSLCYQEQFYAVCFLAVLLAPRRLYGVMAGATLVFLLTRLGASDIGALSRIQGLFPFFWQEFAVGLAVYWRLNVARSRRARLAVDLGLLLPLVGVQVEYLPSSSATAAVFGLFLIAMRRWDARLAGAPALGWVRACGRRCYSIYLVHLPVMIVASTMLFNLGLETFWARALVLIPASMAISVAAGWAFYRVVESRFLEPPARPSPPARPRLARFDRDRPAVASPVPVAAAA
jgi:peptidoglycan/LPS O-acetylase OafA/YrhL